jgi:hypothetical protein
MATTREPGSENAVDTDLSAEVKNGRFLLDESEFHAETKRKFEEAYAEAMARVAANQARSNPSDKSP